MSETGSSDGEDQKEVPGLLPLSNGFLPPNFAALLASATGTLVFFSISVAVDYCGRKNNYRLIEFSLNR